MTHACDDFEIEIEMRAAGALDPDAITRLDHHLAGCAACRAWQAQARRVDEALTTSAVSEAPLDWDRIRGKLDRTVQNYRRGFVQWLVSLPMMFLACYGMAALTGFTLAPWMWVASFGAFTGLFTWIQLGKLRQLRALAAERDVIGAWRTQLHGNLKLWRIMRVWAPLAVPFIALQLPGGITEAQAGLASGRFTILVAAVQLVAVVLCTINLYNVAKTSRRELAELG